jgi:uncharacterized protein with HEPN domain
MRSDDALLLDMLIAARKILRFTADMTLAAFEADEMAQSAVIRELQVIGEAARLVSDEAKAAYSAIDWRTMTGMRNRLVHEYFAIRLDVVWQTATEDIPPLIVRLNEILPSEADAQRAEEPESDG